MTIADLRKEVQQLKDEAQQKAIATAGTIWFRVEVSNGIGKGRATGTLRAAIK